MKILAIATAGAALTVSAVAWAAAPNVPAMHAFGHCAAQRGPKDVTYLLDQDFRSGGYNSALKALAKKQATCPGSGAVAGGGLFAGALAEELLEYGHTPRQVATMIGKAPKKPVSGKDDTENAALCAVRANAGGAAQLLASGYGSREETAALKGLTPALNGCLKGKKLGAGGSDLRAIIALAAFRNFRAAGG
ncbi:MAG TPA: hypothetical protein VKC17_05550 [Sphingomicrobium sp.]|nr:hypothetical protein [Sphingomicrobium sp.]